MNDKNQILEALGKLPELIESIKALIEESEKKDAFLAKMAETKVEAQMSDEGKQEIVDIVEETVKATPCATPSVTEAGQLIADAVCDNVRNSVGEAIREKIANMSIKLEHHHTHDTSWELAKLANKAAKRWILTLVVLSCLFALWGVGSAIWFFNSEMYWGWRYSEVYTSKYTTQEERTLLWSDLMPTGFLPKKYKSNPDYVKSKIKQNETVLKGRRDQAERNKGQFSISAPIEQ